MPGFFRKRITSLNATITRYYLHFFLMIPALVILSVALGQGLSLLITGGVKEMKLVAAVIVRPDYKNIDISDIQKYDGWVEILKDNKVVDVLGNKRDDKMEYSYSDLGISNTGPFSRQVAGSYSDASYYYSTAKFVGTDHNEYLCMVKIPRSNIESGLSSAFNVTKPEMRILRVIFFSFCLTAVIFFLLFTLFIIAYGRLTAKKITRPLKAIGQGIAAITAGDLSARMDFEAEREFAEIRDALNYMARRLQSAEQEKRDMEDNKQKLIMGISHDLKTPITTVYGYAKALSDGMVEDPERQKRHLNYIRDKAQIMTRLIDDLFKYSSMEGSEYTLKRQREDFAEFLRELIAENYIEIENHGFQLELDIPEHELKAQIDRAEMHRALSNIIGNAVKYNPPGTTLSISLAQADGSLHLTIGDDGIGISGEIRSTIFNEFVRGDAARVSDGGSGLGLAIAKRIIEMHGGSITLESEQGRGTVFVITLPSAT